MRIFSWWVTKRWKESRKDGHLFVTHHEKMKRVTKRWASFRDSHPIPTIFDAHHEKMRIFSWLITKTCAHVTRHKQMSGTHTTASYIDCNTQMRLICLWRGGARHKQMSGTHITRQTKSRFCVLQCIYDAVIHEHHLVMNRWVAHI